MFHMLSFPGDVAKCCSCSLLGSQDCLEGPPCSPAMPGRFRRRQPKDAQTLGSFVERKSADIDRPVETSQWFLSDPISIHITWNLWLVLQLYQDLFSVLVLETHGIKKTPKKRSKKHSDAFLASKPIHSRSSLQVFSSGQDHGPAPLLLVVRHLFTRSDALVPSSFLLLLIG